MNLKLVLGLLFWASLVQAADEPKLSFVIRDKKLSYSLKDLKSKLKVISVEIDDPVYHVKKNFDGFDLRDLLKWVGVGPAHFNDEVVFTSQDGYAPNTTMEKIRAHRGVLVFQEHGGPEGGFGKITQGKETLSPAPFYLVWEEGVRLEHEVPWPYQLVQIEVADMGKKYSKIFPGKVGVSDPSAVRGFILFKDQCIRCHSVNLQGGDLGPELNIPKNVTEYWDVTKLRAFIKDSSKFRLRDKMPPFPNLSEKDIDDVLKYLIAMRASKILPE